MNASEMQNDGISMFMTMTPDKRRDEVVALFMEIMNIYSVSDHEEQLADYVDNFLTSCGHLTVQRLGDTVVASTNFGHKQRVILAGHIDVVPVIDNFPALMLDPGDERIRPEIAQAYPDSEVIWGRGATDMKASDAAFLYLAKYLNCPEKTQYDITYIFYDHEEVSADKNGLGKLVAAYPQWVDADFAIIGEPTNNAIEGGCNGTMRFDIVLHGQAAHSARAWMGDNAIHHAARVLSILENYEPATVHVDGLDYREGLNATLISGGEGTNIIPQECRIHVNYRFAPDKTVLETKAVLMGEQCARETVVDGPVMRADGGLFAGYDIQMRDESAGARPGLTHPIAQSLVNVARKYSDIQPSAKLGWTDVARFSQLGIPAINCGAGDALLAHRSDEQIACAQLCEYVNMLSDWMVGHVMLR